jgi:integrase/recombinase XerD
MTAVKEFYRRMRRCGVFKSDPAELLELPRVPRRLPGTFLTVEEVESLLQQTLLHGLNGIRDRAILETYYATGIRRMELATLDIDDVDLKRGIVRVNRGKGNKDRRVPIAKRACDWIAMYLNSVRPKFAVLESGQALFLANDCLRYSERKLTYIAGKYVRRAGIKKRGACNLFRHTAATLMHEGGADLLYVKEFLGHADVSTTQVYAHVTIRKLREVYAKTHPAAFTKSTPPSIKGGSA